MKMSITNQRIGNDNTFGARGMSEHCAIIADAKCDPFSPGLRMVEIPSHQFKFIH